MQRDRLPESDEALENELSKLPLPAARDAFREQLWLRFVGEAESRPNRVPVQLQALSSARSGQMPVAPAGPSRPPRRRWPLAVGLPAALLIALLGVAWLLREPAPRLRLTLSAPDASATVEVDGQLVTVPHLIPFDLPVGSERVITRDQAIWLRLADRVLLECPPGTDLGVLHMPAEQDSSPRFELVLFAGMARVVTGPAFAGSKLSITTPDASLEVVGTQFVVEIRPDGTCVCCREGSVRVAPRGSEAFEATPASQHMILSKGGAVVEMAMDMAHMAPLDRLAKAFPSISSRPSAPFPDSR